MAHRSERPSSCSVSFRAAKDSLLQDRRHDQHSRASNKIVPEITDIRCSEQDEDERLGKERREKHGRSSNSTNKESCQKETEDTAIEHRTQNVTCFDQIFDQTGERSHADSN